MAVSVMPELRGDLNRSASGSAAILFYFFDGLDPKFSSSCL
jgi:hypothetical protein